MSRLAGGLSCGFPRKLANTAARHAQKKIRPQAAGSAREGGGWRVTLGKDRS